MSRSKTADVDENECFISFRLPQALMDDIERLRTLKKKNGLFSFSMPRSAFLREVISLGLQALEPSRKGR